MKCFVTVGKMCIKQEMALVFVLTVLTSCVWEIRRIEYKVYFSKRWLGRGHSGRLGWISQKSDIGNPNQLYMCVPSGTVMADSLRPMTIAHQAPLSMGFSSKNTGVGCHALLQRVFPPQEPNPGLPRCRWILYHLSLQGVFCITLFICHWLGLRCCEVCSLVVVHHGGASAAASCGLQGAWLQ